jgi:hypothetical protein
MGAKDIRWNTEGKTDFRLARQLRAYTKVDDPPAWVKPVPIQVVAAVVNAAYNSMATMDSTKAVADMIVLAFFYSLRPGKYTYATDNTPLGMSNCISAAPFSNMQQPPQPIFMLSPQSP